jgi:GNAT superfamily N-acetyltransferase
VGEVARAAGIDSPVPLSAAHDCSAFNCGDDALNDWLRERALAAAAAGHSRTFVCCAAERVVGYYCIAAGGILRASAPGRLRRNAPDPLPVAIIGRLAVDRSQQGRGLGTDLVADALLRIVAASDTLGLAAVLVHAASEPAAAFWRRHDFIPFPPDGRTFFLPLGRIARLL